MAKLSLAHLLGLLLLAACASPSQGTDTGPALPSPETGSVQPTDGLKDLQGLDGLKVLFNQDTGTPRLLLLMSPT